MPADQELIEKLRRQVGALICARLAIERRPLEEEDVPQWVRRIVAEQLNRFHVEHPDGLPLHAARAAEIAAAYQRAGQRAFDLELPEQFELEPPGQRSIL